jgi:hypothetical protein
VEQGVCFDDRLVEAVEANVLASAWFASPLSMRARRRLRRRLRPFTPQVVEVGTRIHRGVEHPGELLDKTLGPDEL